MEREGANKHWGVASKLRHGIGSSLSRTRAKHGAWTRSSRNSNEEHHLHRSCGEGSQQLAGWKKIRFAPKMDRAAQKWNVQRTMPAGAAAALQIATPGAIGSWVVP